MQEEWGEEQVRTLLVDLGEEFRRQEVYYLNSYLVSKNDDTKALVDGQQRMP